MTKQNSTILSKTTSQMSALGLFGALTWGCPSGFRQKKQINERDIIKPNMSVKLNHDYTLFAKINGKSLHSFNIRNNRELLQYQVLECNSFLCC